MKRYSLRALTAIRSDPTVPPMRRICPLLLLAACSTPDLVKRIHDAPTELWIANTDVIDVITGSVARGRDVHIKSGLIAEIVPAGAAPAGAIDGRGASLIPGLIDAHVHINSSGDPPWTSPRPDATRNLQSFLYCGVTTVFETGGMSPDAFELRDAVAAGKVLGPRIFTTGPLFTAPHGHPVPMLENGLPAILEWYVIPRTTRQVGSVEEANLAIDELAALHPDAIKIVLDQIPNAVPELTQEIATAIVARAREKGLRSVAHIGTTTDAISAGEAGVAAWVHGIYKERIPDEAIARLAAYHIPMVPTLVVFEGYAVVGRAGRPTIPLERETVAAAALDARDHPPADVPMPEGGREFLKLLASVGDVGLDNVKRLHAAGVTILAGSDSQAFTYHGPGLHRELALLAKVLTPIEVLRAATVSPARFLTKMEDPPFGVIAPGKAADLVLVEGDPLADVAALSKIRAVIAGGVKLERLPLGH